MGKSHKYNFKNTGNLTYDEKAQKSQATLFEIATEVTGKRQNDFRIVKLKCMKPIRKKNWFEGIPEK